MYISFLYNWVCVRVYYPHQYFSGISIGLLYNAMSLFHVYMTLCILRAGQWLLCVLAWLVWSYFPIWHRAGDAADKNACHSTSDDQNWVNKTTIATVIPMIKFNMFVEFDCRADCIIKIIMWLLTLWYSVYLEVFTRRKFSPFPPPILWNFCPLLMIT